MRFWYFVTMPAEQAWTQAVQRFGGTSKKSAGAELHTIELFYLDFYDRQPVEVAFRAVPIAV